MSGYDPTTLRSYRLGNGRLLAWSVLVIVAVLAGQALIAGEGTGRWLAVTAAAAIACAAWVLGIRPVVRELPTVLEVHNPIRTWAVTWSSITKVDADDVVRIHAGDEIVRCFALPRRDKRPIISGFVSAFGGRPLPASDTEPVRSSVTTYDVIEALEDRASQPARRQRLRRAAVVGRRPRGARGIGRRRPQRGRVAHAASAGMTP